MRFIPNLVLVVAMALSLPARAEVSTDHHRAVYAEINANTERFSRVVDSTTVGDAGVSLTGWMDGKKVRKIVATTGRDVTEYYLENEKPLFVFSVYDQLDSDGNVKQRVEERIYFKDGEIVKWLANKDLGYAFQSEDYISQAAALKKNTADFIKVLKGKREVSEGTFVGIEQGDYAHWKMRGTDGGEISLFVLNPDATVAKVLDNPKRFEGKKCRVTWKSSKQKIPEAGGSMQIDQILAVDWL